jgi:hypothetical protein
MRKLLGLLGAGSFVLISSPALAQEFGEQGHVAFSAERLFGVHGTHVYEELDPHAVDGTQEVEDDYIGLSFGWRGPVSPQSSPFDTPRLAFDYFIIDRLSVGGSIAYASGSDDSGDFSPAGLAVPVGSGPSDYSAFLFAPRAGYALMFSDWVGIWPRLGLTYHTFSVSNIFSEDGLALSIEAMFVLAPVEGFGILIGPTADFDLFGSRDYEAAWSGGNNVDRSYRTFGLQVGLMAWL